MFPIHRPDRTGYNQTDIDAVREAARNEMAQEQGKILIIEDDPDIRTIIKQLLSGENYQVSEAESAEEGLPLLDEDTDLVILDIMLPNMSGLSACEKIRETSNVPVLFLTAKSQESDKLIGLMAGGDDYLPKPFSYAELLGRIKALLRRYRVYRGKEDSAGKEKAESSHLRFGDLSLDTAFNHVEKGGEACTLSDIEYRMLRLMMQHPNQIFSAQMLYETIWNEPYFYTCSNTVMVHIRKIRKAVEDDPNNPKRIRTIWGKGYQFETHSGN